MKLSEIHKLYPDEWVLVKVTKENTRGELEEAEVITHHPDRDKVYDAMSEIKSGEHVATIFTGEILKDGEAFSFTLCSKK
ncbi:hypothetical protein KC571_03230 [candidate division WWE3 bacterium]|uniref:DUF5678 domain-containing protein n=1 Tax=candidate division WWE3 bacterium TaxID=2053526 RepID=A0A955LGX6_UNCKA|nr:hypothetical protein [candidate division WWE3 bacterium]